jgi:hypothetical protein
MEKSPEVLIYLQTVKKYIDGNEDAKKYFIANDSEPDFFDLVSDISQINFEKRGQPELSKEQFESLRQVVFTVEVNKDELSKTNEDNIFIDMRGYYKICLN